MSRSNLIVTILLFLSSFSFGQPLPKLIQSKDFSIGESLLIRSNKLNENREINIYLPENYSIDSLKSYPVIYLLDGSKGEDFIHIAGIVQFGTFSWVNLLPESIVVGIGNVDRKRDFTYPSSDTLDKKEFPTAGKSADFIEFIKLELQPFIESKYRTNHIKTVIGQSFAGLLTTEILFKEPDLFDNYIIVSPSLWWDNEKLLTYKPKAYQAKKSIYIAVGKEGEVMERTAKELYTKLDSIRSKNTMLHFDFLSDRLHGDALHLAVYKAFEKIFKPVKD